MQSVNQDPIRPLRMLIPASLADRLDDAVARGLGGFTDRHALTAAAIDDYLLQLEYDTTEPLRRGFGETDAATQLGASLPAPGDEQGRVGLPQVGQPVVHTVVVDEVTDLSDEPLLGLHNRDWPSLWALGVLGELTADGAIPWRTFLSEVTGRAWKIAESIQAALPDRDRRLTALLPTNREKAQSAESVFQDFALGSVGRRPLENGRYRASGPLPQWRAVGLLLHDELLVALTETGWALLDRTAGLEAAARHPANTAKSFLDFLGLYAPGDWWGFQTMLRAVVQQPTRDDYISLFAEARDWKESVASSAAQGYLARGREWGLVEPKIQDGKYLPTELGREMANAW